MTQYEAVYGQVPPSPISNIPGCSKVQVVDQILQNHATMIACLKDNIHQAQNQMKQQADQHRSEHTFQEGDQVFLRLQPYKKISIKKGLPETSSKILSTLSNTSWNWSSSLQASLSTNFKNPSSLQCIMPQESGGEQL